MPRAWFDERPGLLEEELKALDEAGIAYEINEPLRGQGILRLRLYMTLGDEELDLVALYPDLYPYVRPLVFAPELDLGRHQHPFDRNLCLLGRSTDNWDLGRTLAFLLTDQLPKVLAAARDPSGPAAEEEERQGEPYSEYYIYQPGASVALDSGWLVGEAERGTFRVRLAKHLPEPVPNVPIIRGIITELRVTGQGTIHEAEEGLLRLIPDGTEVNGRWFRVKRMPRQALDDPQNWASKFVAELRAIDERMAQPQREQFGRDLWIDILGLVFEEEQEWRRNGEGWIFFVRVGRRKRSDSKRQRADTAQWAGYLARAVRLGRDDVASRIPELVGLRNKRVALIGLGGIGAPIALELAKSGIGELRLLDHDVADPGTLVRWPFGFSASQWPKVEVVKQWIEKNIPYVEVVATNHRIGRVRAGPGEPSDADVLDKLLTGVDLVIDATAEVGIHYPVAEMAREKGIPYLEASARNGAWGGVVARVLNRPGDPCWVCLAYRLHELDQEGQPARAPGGLRQPVGCADPTFTGAGFDVASISMAANRLAAAILSEGADGAYPNPPWDLAIINLRAADGSAGTPEWLTFPLELHPDCGRRSHD